MGRSAVDVTRNLFGALMAVDFGRALESRDIVSYLIHFKINDINYFILFFKVSWKGVIFFFFLLFME